MSPLLVAIVSGAVCAAVVAVAVVLVVRRVQRGTGWREWRAEARTLPRSARRTITRTTQQGRPAPVELAGSAVRYGRAVLAARARTLATVRRPVVRVAALLLVVLGVALIAVYVTDVVRGDASFVTWPSIAGWVVLVVLYGQIVRGRPLGHRGTAEVERSVRLNEEAVREGSR